ncbi:leucyl aminopeptidase family protein [Litorilituus lipolyticus]|uniref:Probable cytosol aminopeptidase n=1 Tax=Litorilituus lipolyticus TaxID=2491017 RepID=A0A502KVZ4_9GAMM|nr:leucyl aminopeptidase [Litorilituus lipolyticus]TPH14599.1 leucyl aminopeptidase [Litorilituus lipolyticus]
MKAKLTKLSSVLMAVAISQPVLAETFHFNEKLSSKSDTLVVFKGKANSTDFVKFDKKTEGQLSRALTANKFDGGYNSFTEVLAPNKMNYDRVLIVGIGDEPLSKAKLTKLGGNIAGKLTSKHINDVSVAAEHFDAKQVSLLAHGINLRAYNYDKYKKEKYQEKTYTFDVADKSASKSAYGKLEHIESGIFLARDLTNEVPTELTAVDFAAEAKKLEKLGVKVTVLTPKEIKKLGMNALEGVGRGSSEGSRLIVAHYEGSNDAPIAIAGKGITFDSGGYQIKTSESIVRMKSDMAGAAAALGTVKALAKMKAEVNVVAVMGVAANMVSEKAQAPGDVVRTAEGLSVEITHTDAEGRLVLIDAMWYARKHYKPSVLVDIATLTGGKYRALGTELGGIFSDNEQLVTEITMAGKAVNEPVWRLPLGYKDRLKSTIADLRNTGKGGPSATTAATFLQQFAGDTPWIHIDMAGNALASSAKGEVPVGGTGYGVRLLTEWVLNQHKVNE